MSTPPMNRAAEAGPAEDGRRERGRRARSHARAPPPPKAKDERDRRFGQFLREVRAELRKVVWPSQGGGSQRYSIIVLITRDPVHRLRRRPRLLLRVGDPVAVRPMTDRCPNRKATARWSWRLCSTMPKAGGRRGRRARGAARRGRRRRRRARSTWTRSTRAGRGPVTSRPIDELVERWSTASWPTRTSPATTPGLRPGDWYVVHTQSGYEKKVKSNLEARISSMNMEDKIFEVVIPMEDVVEFKGGKKVVVQRKVFPGYLLVRCQLDDDSWYVDPQHARRHRVRRPGPPRPEADAAQPPRGRDVPGAPRATARTPPSAASPGSSTRSARASG